MPLKTPYTYIGHMSKFESSLEKTRLKSLSSHEENRTKS